jgi:hypothetical protein
MYDEARAALDRSQSQASRAQVERAIGRFGAELRKRNVRP